MFLSFISIFFYLLTLIRVKADDSNSTGLFPNANLTVPLFTPNTTFRQNFCDIQSQFHNGEVELRTAFEGRNLHVSLTVDPDYVYRNEDGSINLENPGLLVKLMDEIALRGKFSWRDTFVWEDYYQKPADQDWTDLLLWAIDSYDMSANWWFDTLTRASLGASFPKGWLDGSLIIVTTKDDGRQDAFKPFSWAEPFTWTVWVAIIATLVVSALISALVEGRSRRNEAIFTPFEGSVVSTLLSYLHQAFLVVTGHLDLIPNTHAGQLVSLSMSFFAMLLLSAYTANLASFLVVERTSARLAVNTVNDIVQARQSICVWGGTPVEEEILALYENAILVKVEGDDGVLTGVRKGECNFGVVALSSYELFQGKEEVNTDCNLIRVGRNFKTYENGLAVKADAGTLCTSLVRDMLNVHMKDLFEEGYIDELWKDLYREKHDVEDPTCFDETVISDTNSDTLNLTNVIGIFMVHGGLLFLALLVYILERYLRKRKKLNGRDSTRADILRHSQFQRHSLNAHTQFTSSNSIEGDHESTETAVLSEKVDVIESKVLGMESKMEDMATTLSEILKAVKQEQPVNVYDSSNRKSYTKQDTTDTARSSIQYDLGGNGDYEERFDDDNFSYDTNAVFR